MHRLQHKAIEKYKSDMRSPRHSHPPKVLTGIPFAAVLTNRALTERLPSLSHIRPQAVYTLKGSARHTSEVGYRNLFAALRQPRWLCYREIVNKNQKLGQFLRMLLNAIECSPALKDVLAEAIAQACASHAYG